MSRFTSALVLLILSSGILLTQAQSDTLIPITADNLHDIRLLHKFDGVCLDFSPHTSYLVVDRGGRTNIYDLHTGDLRIVGQRVRYNANFAFSPGDSFLAIPYSDASSESEILGVFDLATGQRRFEIVRGIFPVFSPDGTRLAVAAYSAYQNAVYEVTSGKLLFTYEGGIAVFSPDSKWLISEGFVYDASTGQRLYDLTERTFRPSYSPDSERLAVPLDAIYDVETGQRLLEVPRRSGDIKFSPDDKLVAVGYDGVYDLTKFEKQFSIIGREPVFSPNGSWLGVSNDGMYSVSTGERLYDLALENIEFSPDGSLFSGSGDLFLLYSALYETTTGKAVFKYPHNVVDIASDGTMLSAEFSLGKFISPTVCTVFAISDIPFRGLIDLTKGVNVRERPSLTALVVRATKGRNVVYIYARTPDSNWYRIGDQEWVSASVVNPVYIPDNLPVEAG